MLRAGEAVLALAPLLLAALLYAIVFRRLPSRRAVLVLTVAETLLAIALIWSGTADSLRPHERYVPAQLREGSVVDGHGG